MCDGVATGLKLPVLPCPPVVSSGREGNYTRRLSREGFGADEVAALHPLVDTSNVDILHLWIRYRLQ